MKKLIASAVLSVGLVASLHASNGADLILGFRATGGVGSGTNLEVDLGNVSTFFNQAGGTTADVLNLLDSGTLGAGNTIDSVYGSNWDSRSDLVWGIIGSPATVVATGPEGEPAKTLWVSSTANSSLLDGTASGAVWNGTVASLQSGGVSKVAALYANLPGNAETISETTPGAWTTQEGGASASKVFSNLFLKSQFENNTNIVGNGGTYVASDLYQVSPSGNQPGNFLGTFAITNTGDVTFTALSAIPEPTTYAAILGVAALGFAALRRRRNQAV